MRLLVLDHHFGQDIDALRAEAGDAAEIRTIPFNLLRLEALRVFPEDVATGLEAYATPEYEGLREEWTARLEQLLEEQMAVGAFDAFVCPSDVFFYVRTAPQACHRLGVPFFVAQKETTISPETMESHAKLVREYAPPVADRMTVCSAHHREFWLRCGADPETVVVTGQPRFDFYAGVPEERVEAGYGESGPVAVFFSYQADAYHPTDGGGRGVWSDLHAQTEAGLWQLAEKGWRILIKPHPQQDWDHEKRRIADEAGSRLGDRVFLVDPAADARDLIAGADAIVGFQTTALLEGMAAGRPVIYTGWDPEATRVREGLIPFHEWGEAITVVEKAEELPAAVERAASTDPAGTAFGVEIATGYLGPIDGGASRRTLEEIELTVRAYEQTRSPEVEELREQAAARRPPLALGRRARAGVQRARVAAARALGR